jgi:hypothetical protein
MNMGMVLGIPFINKVKRVMVFDHFQRPDSTSLGKANTGHTWQIVGVSGEIKNKTYISFSSGSIVSVNVGKSDYRVSSEISQVAGGTLGLAFRIKDYQNYYAVRIYQRNLEVFKFTGAGNVTLIGSYNGPFEGLKHVMVEVKVNTIKAFVDQKLLLTITDNDLMGIFNVGFRGGGTDSFAKNIFVEEL